MAQVANLDWKVALVDATGVAITTGGTQYADGATQANPTGNVALWLDAANVLRAASATKPLPVSTVSVPATISTANSTTTPLGGGAVFTGTSEDVSGCGSINVEVFANVASATGGLSFQNSTDGTNWDFTQGVTVAAGVAQTFVLAPMAKFFRIVYTNGAGAQASFRLQTVCHTIGTVKSGAAFQDVNGTLSPTYIGERLAADMMIQSAADNATNRMRSAKDIAAAGGVGGGTHIGAGMAFLAAAHGTNPTAITAGNFGAGLTNRAGVPFMMGGHPNVVTVRANYTAAQTDTALVTVAAGLKIVCTRITFACDKANTVNVAARAGFGTANTPTTTGVLASHPGIDPGGGMNVGTGAGIIGVGADDADLRVTCGAPTTGSIDVCASYFTIDS